jgi:hypothetical protein
MYQTVGQDAIELVAGALGVPLFRRTIYGSAVEQGGEYGDRGGQADRSAEGVTGDETEDMFALLSEVKVRRSYCYTNWIVLMLDRLLTQIYKVFLSARSSPTINESGLTMCELAARIFDPLTIELNQLPEVITYTAMLHLAAQPARTHVRDD